MKTKVITKLKKEILLVELPENVNLFNDLIFLNSEIEGYTLLGKPDEIKEEDVRSLVSDFDAFENSKYYYLHGFWKLIEKEIYWVNPEPKLSDFEYFLPSINEGVKLQKKFDEAQEKTFDRKRTLIFVKN